MRVRRTTAVRIGVLVTAAALVAVACGGSSKSSGGSGGNGGSGGTTAADTGTPKPGGHLVMGTEAEIDGFDPTSNRWDVTGFMYGTTVYDPLAAFGKDNKVHPYLAQSITHSADYRTWTIKLRPNVTFSNGDPLTADDVVTDLTAYKKAALVGHVFDPMDSATKVDDLTTDVHMNEPWVAFSAYLVGQTGVIFDPKMLNDPNRSQHPIGTGPFILKEWIPGNHFLAVKNPNYWQKGLPYLDSVEFRPIIETQSRENSLLSGTIDMFHSSDPQTIVDLKGNSKVKYITDQGVAAETEEDLYMINTAKPPFDDVILRQALAYATDRTKYNNVINFGVTPDSTGPFGNTGSRFHAPTGYPNYDLAKAKSLVKQYEQKHGVSSVNFELGVTNTGRSLQAAQLLQDMWKQAGFNASIKQVEQSQFILLALQGSYQVYGWRQFGEPDPDADFIWWSSTTALPIGQLALNFSRNKDPQIDADLQTGRTNPNEAARVAAYQDIARRLAIDVPFIWTNEAVWQIAFKPNVHGVTTWTLPDGSPGVDHTLGIPSGGAFIISHVWMG
jgi:peptide/nickel transport system substrate-binding protein